MRAKPSEVLKLEFRRPGKTPINARIEFETTEPQANREHESLETVRPMFVTIADTHFYPVFQRFKGSNTLYRNIATCISCFRNSNHQVSDFDILMWFFTPNEFLEMKTPVEVGRQNEKEVRNRIIEAAEQDAPLGFVR